MVYHRFKEALRFIDSSFDMPQIVCTSQVISRCIDMRNYKEIEPWKLPKNAPTTRSFLNAFNHREVSTDPDEIKLEANLIFELILPHAVAKKEVLTRALNMAVFHSDFDLIDRLISFGWDKFGADEEGLTPLMMAIRHHRRGVFSHLIKKGIDIHYVNYNGENLVHYWARKVHSDHVINVLVHDLIVNENLDCKRENLDGFTPIQIATKNDNHDILDYLQEFY